MIDSAIPVFQETTLHRRIEAMAKAKVVSLLETASHEAAKGVKSTAYQAVERVVRRIVARGTVNEVINMKDNNLA